MKRNYSSENKDRSDLGMAMLGLFLVLESKRSPTFFRKRWDFEYLINLANNENSQRNIERMLRAYEFCVKCYNHVYHAIRRWH
jgi:hypothetical protein